MTQLWPVRRKFLVPILSILAALLVCALPASPAPGARAASAPPWIVSGLDATADNNTPFPSSTAITAIVGAQWETPTYTVANVTGDSFVPTWAADGSVYSAIADATVGSTSGTNLILKVNDPPMDNTTAPAISPTIQSATAFSDLGCTNGAYPPQCYVGQLTDVNNVLYATPFLNDESSIVAYSTNHGLTWIEGSKHFTTTNSLATLSFVEEGQSATAPDGYIYGITSRGAGGQVLDQNTSNIWLGRVRPGITTVPDPAQWQYFAGLSGGQPTWTSPGITSTAMPLPGGAYQPAGDFWHGHIFTPEIVYDAGIGRYLMIFTRAYYAFPTFDPVSCQGATHDPPVSYDPLNLCESWAGGAELVLLEAPHAWGPWNFVMREPYSGSGNAYTPAIVPKWISPNGRDLWLTWAANFSTDGAPAGLGNPPNPPGPAGTGGCTRHVRADLCRGFYGINLRRLHLTLATDPGALPMPWHDQDVGTAFPGGVTCANSGGACTDPASISNTYTITGNGTDLDNDPLDQFHFAYQTLTGDGQIVARIPSFSGPARQWPSVGVMMREQTEVMSDTNTFISEGDVMSDTARFAYLALYGGTGTGKAAFQWRGSGGTGETNPIPAGSVPWLKLVRSGNTLSGYLSADGVNWGSPVGSVTMTGTTLATNVKVGLAVTSQTYGYGIDTFPNYLVATATVDHVGITSTQTSTISVDDVTQGAGPDQVTYIGESLWSQQVKQGIAPTQSSDWGNYTGPGCGLYHGTETYNNVTGDLANVKFVGTQISFYGVKNTDGGHGLISVDGGAPTDIDFYSPSCTGNQVMWTSPTLTRGTHTLQLVVKGTHDPDSTDNYVYIDRVDVTP